MKSRPNHSTVLAVDSRRLLELAFGDRIGEVWVCWKGNMAGKRVRDLKPGDLPDDADCYFCPALLKADATTRSNANAERVFVMVVDDVGTKIDRAAFEMFAPEPSYMVESSPGNFQAGYVIAGGMDVEEYRRLRKAMKKSAVWGHADGVDPVHLFRLPQGTNTKTEASGWRVVH